MSICIPDTSAFLTVSHRKTCFATVLQEISRAKANILLSSVQNDFQSSLGRKYAIVSSVCEQIKRKPASASSLGELLACEFESWSSEEIEKLCDLARRVVDCAKESDVKYSEAMSDLVGLLVVEPMSIFEAVLEKYGFQLRDDNWMEKHHRLKEDFEEEFSTLVEIDRTIISQAYAVRQTSNDKLQVQVVTTKQNWKFLNSKPIKGFGVNVICGK
jgi:hypothetical protein